MSLELTKRKRLNTMTQSATVSFEPRIGSRTDINRNFTIMQASGDEDTNRSSAFDLFRKICSVKHVMCDA